MRTNCPCFAMELESASLSYGHVVALREVDVAIEPGEKVALLGTNGCGKSTLLKILGGVLQPSAGRYQAFGQVVDVKRLSDDGFSHWLHRQIGFVFENSDAQLFCPTVREEIAFGPLQMGIGAHDVECRVAEMAELLNVEPLLDRSPYQLSAGQKKRVAVASVLSMGPQVVLLDEPTNGLDPRSQHALIHLMGMLHRAGKTLVTSTHDLSILPEIAERVMVLGDDHRLAFEGTPAELLSDPDRLLQLNLIHEHQHARWAWRPSSPEPSSAS